MKKGFTLIELLAVIVILAIIALIATPIVIDIISDTKLGSVKSSMNNIEKAVELYYSSNIKDENIILECNKGVCKDNDGKKLEAKGNLPESGKINISKTGKITYESLVIDGYLCDKYNDKFVCNKQKGKIVESNGESIVIKDNKTTVLNNYKIYGNSIVENSNINSVGDKSSNLVDLSKTVVSTSTPNVTFKYDNMTGSLELTSKPTAFDYTMLYLERDLGIQFEDGKTYYYGADITISGKQTNLATTINFGIRSDEAPVANISFTENGTYHIGKKFTYTGQINIRLNMHFNINSEEPAQVKFENIYLSEKNEYEPFEKYTIPLEVKGNNLMNSFLYPETKTVNGITFTNNGDSTFTLNGTMTDILSSISLTKSIDLSMFEEGETYIGTCGNDYSDDERRYYLFASIENTETGNIRYFSSHRNSTFTLNKNEVVTAIEIRIYASSGNLFEVKDLILTPYLAKGNKLPEKLELNNKITTIIYLKEPLRKLDNYVDYIDYNNKKVIRNVGVIKLTGEENFEINNGYFTLKLDSYPKIDEELSISNYLEYGNSFWFDKDKLNIKIEGINTKEELKEWLLNNKVEINYPLSKSIISEIELPEININNNYSNIMVDTEVIPSKVLLEYN